MKRIKKILASLMVVVMVLTAAPLSGFVGLKLNLDWLSFDWLDFNTKASAATYSGTCGDNLTWTLEEETGELVISGTGAMMEFSDTLSAPWRKYRQSIKKVTVCHGVTSIGSWAFYYFSWLTSITVSDSVTSIGECAFYGCGYLTSVTIPDNVISIGDSAFSYSGIEDITFGNGVASIGSYALSPCYSLTSIIVSDNNTAYASDEYGVLFNKAKTELIKYPTSNPRTSYEVPDTVTTIGESAFASCRNLTKINFPNSVKSIGSWAFSSCTNLENIAIPNGMTTIGDSAFSSCAKFTSIVISDSVTSIGASAFYGCPNLTSIVIPDGIASIGSDAFYNTGYYNDELNWNDSVLYIGNHIIKAKENLSGSYTINEGTKCIAEYAFSSCMSLTSIIIPVSVTSIGHLAFYNCSNILVAEDNAEYSSDDYGVLLNKDKTELIRYPASNTRMIYMIPDSVTSIADGAFLGCTSLTSITLPDGVTSIGNSAFESADSLTSITLPDSVISIGIWAFSECTSLKNIEIGEAVKAIGYCAFYNCRSIANITIPNSVTSIGGSAFSGCISLSSITLGNGIISIDSHMFSSCSRLTNITIPCGVTSIGSYAFDDCYNLTDITIPDSVNVIEQYGFLGCDKLEYVHYKGDKESWDKINIMSHNESLVNTEVHYCDKEQGIPATCLTSGYTDAYYCSKCDRYIATHEIVPAKGHHYTLNEKNATCTTAGEKAYVCSCGDVYTETIPALGHNPEYIKVDPTCKEAGYECYKCTNCGTEYMREELDIIDHISGDWEIVESANCSEDDYKIRKCTMCGEETHRETIPASGHRYEESIVTEPTCEGVGTKRFTCSVCGDSYDEEIAANGHKIKVIRKDPTCTSIGNEQYLCETCGNMIGDMVFLPKLPHTYGEWTVVKDPTATEEGSKEHSCTACGKTETVAIPAIGFETADGVTVDLEKNIISGFNAGEPSLDAYTIMVNDNYVWEYETSNGKLGTGSKAILKDGDTVIGEYTILVYGDTTGDSWYDGQDAIIVDCLANGMLTKDDVGEAVYMAADCNHDGVIDGLDVALLNQAGTLLANVDQSKPTEVLLETSSEYVEYLDLIDQSPEIEIEEDAPEADAETEDTTPEQDAKVDIFEMILNFIRAIIEMILSRIPVPYK